MAGRGNGAARGRGVRGGPALDRPATARALTRTIPALVAALGLLGACAVRQVELEQPPDRLFPPPPGAPVRTVHVVTHAWHTGIVLRAADVGADRLPVLHDWPGVESLEVGWGDRAYWMADVPGPFLALAALFLPTSSIVRVIAFDGRPETFFWASDVLALDLSPAGLERLATFVAASFAEDGAGRPVAVAPGPIPASRWYRGRGRYTILRNSNAWTAEALAAAGVPINPAVAFTAWSVVCQLGPVARVVRLVSYRPEPDSGPLRCRG